MCSAVICGPSLPENHHFVRAWPSLHLAAREQAATRKVAVLRKEDREVGVRGDAVPHGRGSTNNRMMELDDRPAWDGR